MQLDEKIMMIVPFKFCSMLADPNFKKESIQSIDVLGHSFKFSSLRIDQSKGNIPALVLTFETKGAIFEAMFHGHISPLKFKKMRLLSGEKTVYEFFDENNYRNPAPDFFVEAIKEASNEDLLAFMGCYLYRSATLLSKVCAKEDRKYFDKMKTVSRWSWENIDFKIDSKIYEKWMADPVLVEGIKVYADFENGILTNLSRL